MDLGPDWQSTAIVDCHVTGYFGNVTRHISFILAMLQATYYLFWQCYTPHSKASSSTRAPELRCLPRCGLALSSNVFPHHASLLQSPLPWVANLPLTQPLLIRFSPKHPRRCPTWPRDHTALLCVPYRAVVGAHHTD